MSENPYLEPGGVPNVRLPEPDTDDDLLDEMVAAASRLIAGHGYDMPSVVERFTDRLMEAYADDE